MTGSKTLTRLRLTLGGLRRAALIAALAGLASCSVTHVRMEARPVEAVLEIRINGQWVKQQRTRYLYEKPMDDWQSLPWQELDVILRDREARGIFDGETAALRGLIELKKLGIVPEEE